MRRFWHRVEVGKDKLIRIVNKIRLAAVWLPDEKQILVDTSLPNPKKEWASFHFGKGVGRRRKYLKFVEEGIKMERRPELVGGGLIRSMGGWSEVLALRRRGEKTASDERILGGRRVRRESDRGMG